MKSVTISLPLPHRILHPNGRTRAHKWRSVVIKKERGIAHSLAIAASANAKPRWKRATMESRWYFKTNARRDTDNLVAWAKAYIDGIADAGIVENDCGIVQLPPTIAVDKVNPRVEITIQETK